MPESQVIGVEYKEVIVLLSILSDEYSVYNWVLEHNVRLLYRTEK